METSGKAHEEAEQYNSVSSQHQMVDGLTLLNHLVTIPKGGRVLDIGCGTGKLTAILAEKVGPNGYVVGVDPDEERIKIAKETTQARPQNNLKFEVSDAETFPEDKYDLVVCTYVLHWVERQKAVFERVYNNLRPGGQFAFLPVLHMPKLILEMNALLGPEREAIINGKFFNHTVEEYNDLAIETGFDVTFKDSLVTYSTFPNVGGLIEFWFATTNGMFDPAMVDEDVLDEFKKKYAGCEMKKGSPIARFVLAKN